MNLNRIVLSLLFALALPVFSWAEHYTVVVSLDGFRDDYTRSYSTPFIDNMARWGVSATMQPSFPSKTFPNHYTIATGLVPDHHGIIANKFLDQKSGITFALGQSTSMDPQFWGGEPIWNTATRQGVKVGVVYWPGSDVAIGGRYPTYYHSYMKKPLLSYSQRLTEVARMLSMPSDERPHLVMLYFDEPDHTGHSLSPFSKETRAMVEHMDGILQELYTTLQTLPERDSINLIVLSDHGMASVDTQHQVNITDYVKSEWIERMRLDIPTHIWAKRGCEKRVLESLAHMPHVKVWRKSEVPSYLQYGSNANIGDIVVNPDCGWLVTDHMILRDGIRGAHGFDATGFDMQVPFRAIGPDFKRGYRKLQTFQNTNVYPLLCHLLGIQASACDGNLEAVSDLLAQ